MKKMIIGAMMLVASVIAGAQNTKVSEKDTVMVKYSSIKFDKETYESKTGKFKTDYLVLIDGTWYETTKTAYERYYKIKRFGGTPCVCFVKPKESKVKVTPKVIVL